LDPPSSRAQISHAPKTSNRRFFGSSSYSVGREAVNQPHIRGKSTADYLRKSWERGHEYQKTQTTLAAIKEFVFGTKEALPVPTPHFVVSSAPTPTASLTPETALPATPPPFVVLPVATPPKPEASAPDPVPIQSKEPSLMSKLQAPDKEATVRFTVDMSETLHRKLSMLAAKTGRKKVDRLC